MVADYQARPDFYSERIIVPRTQEKLDEYREYVVRIAHEIYDGTAVICRTPTMQCGGCEFFDLCVKQDPKIVEAIRKTDFRVRENPRRIRCL